MFILTDMMNTVKSVCFIVLCTSMFTKSYSFVYTSKYSNINSFVWAEFCDKYQSQKQYSRLSCVGESAQLKPKPQIKHAIVDIDPVLEHRIVLLENMILELCTALVESDDIKLSERETSKIGIIFLDSNLTMSRTPIFLRTQVMKIVEKHEEKRKNIKKKWTPTSRAFIR